MRTLLVVTVMSLAIGCKGKPNTKAAPDKDKIETSAGAKPPVARDVDLPQGPGTPPLKTTKPVDAATIKKMSDLSFDGFVKDMRTANESALWVMHQIPSHPVTRASVHVNPCGGTTTCWPMDLATWQGHTEELKGYLPAELLKQADTVFEVGQTDVHGEKMIYTYQLGQASGGEHSVFSYAYVLYYNDGTNAIRVLTEYKDDMVATKEQMAKALPRTDLENISKAFMDVYTHAWQ